MSPDDEERCARVRAARAYANLKQPELAATSGVGFATIKRIENAQRSPMLEELRAIGDACGVPRSFMELGFLASTASDDDLRLRLQNVETQLASLVGLGDQLSGLERELREVRAQAEELTREALARRQREAVERESTRRGRSSGSSGAEGGR